MDPSETLKIMFRLVLARFPALLTKCSCICLVLCAWNQALAGAFLTSVEGCKVWDSNPAPGETVSWSGACKDGFADGPGIRKWTLSGDRPGSTTEGTFTAGKLEGQGVAKYAGGKYEGAFRADSPNGKGVFTSADGTVYTGDFVDGLRSGKGVTVFPDGKRYEGEFESNYWNGKGVLTWPNGDRYEGDFLRGSQTGKGVLITAGIRREGDFLDGKPVKPGVIAWSQDLRDKVTAAYRALPDPPNRAEPSALGMMQFSIDEHGVITDWTIKTTSGWPEFDERMLQVAKSAQSSLRPYPGDERVIDYPFQFKPSTEKFVIKGVETGSHLNKQQVTGISVPPEASYTELTRDQRRLVKSQYDPMADGDEPPYPLHGQGQIIEAIRKAATYYQPEGLLKLVATIGADGSVQGVSVITSPDSRMTLAAARILAAAKYKPAVCGGTPCKMDYAFSMNFLTPIQSLQGR
jgi:hypothetical protein